MILKRLGAIALTVVLIGGAWLIRDRVIEDNDNSGNDDQPQADREIVCVEDLREACDALADSSTWTFGSRTRRATLDALAALEDPSEAPIWITMEPFPAMVDDLRAAARARPVADRADGGCLVADRARRARRSGRRLDNGVRRPAGLAMCR